MSDWTYSSGPVPYKPDWCRLPDGSVVDANEVVGVTRTYEVWTSVLVRGGGAMAIQSPLDDVLKALGIEVSE